MGRPRTGRRSDRLSGATPEAGRLLHDSPAALAPLLPRVAGLARELARPPAAARVKRHGIAHGWNIASRWRDARGGCRGRWLGGRLFGGIFSREDLMNADDAVFRRALVKLLVEIFEGPPGNEAYVLNPGDAGLVRQLESISAQTAS